MPGFFIYGVAGLQFSMDDSKMQDAHFI